jgi:hypothetical protein
VVYQFQGSQVRLVGSVGPRGGLADVFLDDRKQLVFIDCHSPAPVYRQILYYRNGLASGPHTLRVVARGAGNPVSKGAEIYIEGAQSSDAPGASRFGEGGGPTGAQRLIMGYTGRQDYVDADGHAWRPGTEVIVRSGNLSDAVAKSWWTMRQAPFIGAGRGNAPDQELYRYGVHWSDIRVPLTVGPGTYHVRLKFAETQFQRPRERAIDIWINGRQVVEGFDVLATGGGPNTAVDLVFNGIQPRNGIVEIRLAGAELRGHRCEAMLQAVEVGPGDGGSGTAPKTVRSE